MPVFGCLGRKGDFSPHAASADLGGVPPVRGTALVTRPLGCFVPSADQEPSSLCAWGTGGKQSSASSMDRVTQEARTGGGPGHSLQLPPRRPVAVAQHAGCQPPSTFHRDGEEAGRRSEGSRVPTAIRNSGRSQPRPSPWGGCSLKAYMPGEPGTSHALLKSILLLSFHRRGNGNREGQ